MTSDRRPLWRPSPEPPAEALADQPTPDARLTAVERAVPLLAPSAEPSQQPPRGARRPLGAGGLAAGADADG
ncbi:hypothetical protein ACIQI7_32085 [Kitasatospora sp. NPDC092039]|uniref:hypothetical protein n=1 Tax=Kitasatospora sp. NPDC092039 TaxID=3364086 RepID=UPI00382BD855